MKSLWKQHRHRNTIHTVRVLNPEAEKLIVFFPGWLSVRATWRYFLPELSKDFRIEYFESREKPSALPTEIKCQTFEAHGDDVVSFLNSLENEPYYVACASVGASVYLSVVDKLNRKPSGQVLISPSARSPASKVSGSLAILFGVLRQSPSWLLYILRPAFIAIIERLAAGKDEYQARAAIQSLEAANLSRVTASARQLLRFELDLDSIARITVPTLIIAASHDSAHNIQDAQRIDECLPNSRLCFFDTFTHTRSSVCARKISDWIHEESQSDRGLENSAS